MVVDSDERFLRLRQVLELIPVSRSTWYRGIGKGIYPAPVKLSENVAAWRLSQIQETIRNINNRSKEVGRLK